LKNAQLFTHFGFISSDLGQLQQFLFVVVVKVGHIPKVVKPSIFQ
jgi:hypothetical protein